MYGVLFLAAILGTTWALGLCAASAACTSGRAFWTTEPIEQWLRHPQGREVIGPLLQQMQPVPGGGEDGGEPGPPNE